MSSPGQPPRIALFLYRLSGGGAERVMLTLGRGFVERGLKVDLVVGRLEGELVSEISPEIRIVELKAGRALACIPGLIRYLRRERPHAILSAMEYLNLPALWAHRLARTRTRIAVGVHSTVSVTAAISPQRRGRLLPYLAGRFYGWADAVIAVSEGAARDLCDSTGFPLSRIRVIPNPVITPELLERARATVAHPWLAGSGPPVIVAVGSLTRTKDYPTLLRAFGELRSACDARLLILGEGNERAALENLAAELELGHSFSMPGFVDNPWAYVSRASVYVLPSLSEALPTALIEAMGCGVPVVATDCPHGPSEILEGGVHGRLVPVGDAGALAQAILATLDSPRDIEAARQRANAFRADPAIDAYLELLLG